MRTNIELDSAKVKEASKLTGIKTKRMLIDEALKALIKLHKRKSLLDLAGKIKFSADYDYKSHRN
jgi:Arc/MetJ family transcription regulator